MYHNFSKDEVTPHDIESARQSTLGITITSFFQKRKIPYKLFSTTLVPVFCDFYEHFLDHLFRLSLDTNSQIEMQIHLFNAKQRLTKTIQQIEEALEKLDKSLKE